jgi:hypothetical protein
VTVASPAFQSIVVAFASYLTWFRLLTTHSAGRPAVRSVPALPFGVAFGHPQLGDRITLLSAAALSAGTRCQRRGGRKHARRKK